MTLNENLAGGVMWLFPLAAVVRAVSIGDRRPKLSDRHLKLPGQPARSAARFALTALIRAVRNDPIVSWVFGRAAAFLQKNPTGVPGPFFWDAKSA
jgi:hypothetical protein